MRLWHKIAIGVCAVLLILYPANASWLWGRPGRPTFITHLGLHQRFDERGLSLYDCKADRMLPPTHPYLENTIAAIGEAFQLGAEIGDIDVQPTRDGDYVVFHDARLECRTNGRGSVWDKTVPQLKSLDIGYGYTADKGRTYPFRGKFIGAMPTLGQMLDAYPNRRFMLIMKSNNPEEADLLFAWLKRHNVDPRRLQVLGGDRPAAHLRELAPTMRVGSQQQMKACLTRYLAIGWSGAIPAACRNTVLMVPFNYRKALWGWPNLLVKRMARVNSAVVLIGDFERHSNKPGMNALDRPDQLAEVPRDYAGQIFTSRIDLIGPAARARGMID